MFKGRAVDRVFSKAMMTSFNLMRVVVFKINFTDKVISGRARQIKPWVYLGVGVK